MGEMPEDRTFLAVVRARPSGMSQISPRDPWDEEFANRTRVGS